MFKSVAKNFSIITAATIIVAVITFLFITFVARQFGPSLFGKYILITVYVQVTTMIISAGLLPIALRELARDRENAPELFDDILSLRLTRGIAGYLTLVLIMALSSDKDYLVLVSDDGNRDKELPGHYLLLPLEALGLPLRH